MSGMEIELSLAANSWSDANGRMYCYSKAYTTLTNHLIIHFTEEVVAINLSHTFKHFLYDEQNNSL